MIGTSFRDYKPGDLFTVRTGRHAEDIDDPAQHMVIEEVTFDDYYNTSPNKEFITNNGGYAQYKVDTAMTGRRFYRLEDTPVEE